ncbi:uncharacterized protein LOC130948322 [Arachis stenosperma]|uniref:uncharacterized protein LOC130948322 n=1 Tax=Arachis stenosperma TaxID=217475 RepID=UPI0025AD7CD3|nr:uncharacterized protein LOC130948322 [Arachis stenosperma]
MALALMLKVNNVFIFVALLFIAMFCCFSDGELQEQSIAKVLSCFENNRIYSQCNEAYRLNPSGNINIPLQATDSFCSGPCLSETRLVLNCINDMLSNFVFYNKATAQQMRNALDAGCSFSRERGNFNLGDYIRQETNNACKFPTLIRFYLFILWPVVVHVM